MFRSRAFGWLNGPLALLIASLLAACDEPPQPSKERARPVKAMQIGAQEALSGRAFPGTAQAVQEVELSFRVSGPLITLPITVGLNVQKGDVLAQIDPRDYQVKVRNVQGQLDDAKAALTRADADLSRQQRIYEQDPGATSETAIDGAREARDRAKANVASLSASLTAARDQLSDTELKAPFNGTVVATYVENFEDIRAKQAVARLVDDSRIEMVIHIPENLISLAPDVRNVRVTFDSFSDHEVPAEIKEIGTEASQLTRTYPVTLLMEQPEAFKVLPGMSGRVSGDPPEEVIAMQGEMTIPVSATFAVGDDTFVWIIDLTSNTVSRRAIQTGMLTNVGIGVKSGLSAGEWIATAGVHYLAEGQQVRILSESDN